jgi:hypothetical protein
MGIRIGVSRDRVKRRWQFVAMIGFALHSNAARCEKSRLTHSLNCSDC